MQAIQYDRNDADSVALCSWKESRGDGDEAMLAVMHVIANRVGTPGFAATVHGVVFGKNQFTSMSVPRDPEFNLQPKDGDPQYAFCLANVDSVLSRSTNDDPTRGAHYYDDPKTATSGWFETMIVEDAANHPLVAKIGEQNFYL
jgi:spore germination cell wall hydrolase CwlJ-like protein